MNFKKIICFLTFVIVAVFTASCGNSEESSSDAYVDYVANTKLDQTVTTSSSFFGADGIAYAKVVRCVDGDTVIFEANGQQFTSRFLGVDTPESTGQIEKWGKTASYFTADKVNNAASIVVQTNGGAAVVDTTGGRYLTYVWYQPEEGADYRLLNLELVQEGLSYGKSATATRYSQQLVLAQAQAMKQKLRIFGNSKDPNYYAGNAIECDIKYIIENQKELASDTVKVKFDCTVVRNDGLYVYAQDLDKETNEVYSILLYKGYNLDTSKLENGNRVSLCGNVSIYDNQVQITNMKDIPLSTALDNIQILEENYEIFTTTITPSELDVTNIALGRRLVKLENFVVGNMYTTQSGDSVGSITIYGTCDGQSVTIRTSVLYFENYEAVTEAYFAGKTISVCGIVELYNGSYQIRVVSINDVTIIE